MATLLLIIIYLSFISLGLPDSLLGSAWPAMHQDLSVGISTAGIISFIVVCGTIVSSYTSVRVIRRFGTGKVTLVSVAMTATALLGISFAPHVVFLCLLGIPLGLGAGAVDAALNNFVALHYKAKHMNWLHCFWGLGATAGPMIMALYLASKSGWRQGYLVISLIQISLTVILFASLRLWKPFEHEHERQGLQTKIMPLRQILGIKGAKSALAVFFFYCSLEGGAGLWSGTYLVSYRGLEADVAASWVSMFYFGITVGRFLSGFLAIKISNANMVKIGLCVCAVGVLLLLLPLPALFALAGLALLGLGCAPIFPAMIHETPTRFGKEISQSMIGLQMASAYMGSAMVPPLIGAISGVIGFGYLPIYFAALALVMALLSRNLRRIDKRRAAAHA